MKRVKVRVRAANLKFDLTQYTGEIIRAIKYASANLLMRFDIEIEKTEFQSMWDIDLTICVPDNFDVDSCNWGRRLNGIAYHLYKIDPELRMFKKRNRLFDYALIGEVN